VVKKSLTCVVINECEEILSFRDRVILHEAANATLHKLKRLSGMVGLVLGEGSSMVYLE
jgi:hypothetical protein